MKDQSYVPQKEIIEVPAKAPSGFDLRTHIKDANTGRLVRTQAHRIHCDRDMRYFEFPVDSGNLWFEDNSPAGRVTYKGEGKSRAKTINPDAPHLAFVPLKSSETTVEGILEENEMLRRELAEAKAEREAKIEKKEAVKSQAKN